MEQYDPGTEEMGKLTRANRRNGPTEYQNCTDPCCCGIYFVLLIFVCVFAFLYYSDMKMTESEMEETLS